MLLAIIRGRTAATPAHGMLNVVLVHAINQSRREQGGYHNSNLPFLSGGGPTANPRDIVGLGGSCGLHLSGPRETQLSRIPARRFVRSTDERLGQGSRSTRTGHVRFL